MLDIFIDIFTSYEFRLRVSQNLDYILKEYLKTLKNNNNKHNVYIFLFLLTFSEKLRALPFTFSYVGLPIPNCDIVHCRFQRNS